MRCTWETTAKVIWSTNYHFNIYVFFNAQLCLLFPLFYTDFRKKKLFLCVFFFLNNLAGYAAFCMVLNALPLHIPLFISMLL